MKILFLVALILMSICAHAHSFLFIDEPMSPFCKAMLPMMGVFIVGIIGYAVVKAIRGKDDVS